MATNQVKRRLEFDSSDAPAKRGRISRIKAGFLIEKLKEINRVISFLYLEYYLAVNHCKWIIREKVV